MNSDAVVALETAAWPVLLVDAEGGVCHANPQAVQLFGLPSEGSGVRLSSVWSPENSLDPVQFLAEAGESSLPGTTLRLRTRTKVISCRVATCSCTIEDKKYFVLQLLSGAHGNGGGNPPAEGTMTHKQRLDCALQLARTVALDLNNALTTVLGHTSLVLSQMEAGNAWRHSLLEVEKSAARAAGITNDLGTFSRQDPETRSIAVGSLNRAIQRAVESLQKQPEFETVQWALQLERELFAAKFDESKLQQALEKILENARQAIGESGRITIQTRNLELTQPTQDRNVRLTPGAYVCAEIGDTGCGIPADVLPRIFEPFFTTKGGPHRGLGLAWVYGIVTNLGGGVAVSSRPGEGTSVRMYLPAEALVIGDSSAAVGEDLKGKETILLVDDEQPLLTMGEMILSAYGYRVLTANSGRRAIELLDQTDRPVDLVITDLMMPGMSGSELAEQIALRSPQTRVLRTSGYVWPAGPPAAPDYLQKPFTAQDLLLKVKQALRTAGGPGPVTPAPGAGAPPSLK